MNKGQISIEFMLLLIIMLLYIQAVIIPAMNDSTASVQDVRRIAESNLALEKIYNTANEIAFASGDSFQTITVFIPEETKINCLTGNRISFTTYLDNTLPKPLTCNEEAGTGRFYCEKILFINTSLSLECLEEGFGPNILEQIRISKDSVNGVLSVEYAK
ncbi:MAG: hypothetical protein ABH821_04260 [archaeon]